MLLVGLVHSYMCCAPLLQKSNSGRQSPVQLKTSLCWALKLKYRHSTAIVSPHVIRPQNACMSSPPYSSYHMPPRRTALNIQHKHVQGCSVPSFSSASTVNKCNVCQGCSSHPLEANRRMSHFTKDKSAIRLSLSLLCTSLASSWPMCRLLSRKTSEDFALNRPSKCKQETSALKQVRAFKSNNNLFHILQV